MLKDIYDVGISWHYGDYNPDIKQLIDSAGIIEGIPFGRLEEVRKSKIASAREKDLKDVELVDNYLSLK